MARQTRRRKQRLIATWWNGIKRHPAASLMTAVTLLAGIGAIAHNWGDITAAFDHVRWATPVEAHSVAKKIARDVAQDVVHPLIEEQSRTKKKLSDIEKSDEKFASNIDHNSYGLNFLILKEERKALKDAQDELQKNPSSKTAPQVIEQLQNSIGERQKLLDPKNQK